MSWWKSRNSSRIVLIVFTSMGASGAISFAYDLGKGAALREMEPLPCLKVGCAETVNIRGKNWTCLPGQNLVLEGNLVICRCPPQVLDGGL